MLFTVNHPKQMLIFVDSGGSFIMEKMGNVTCSNDTDDDPSDDMDFSNVPFINDLWIMKPVSQVILESTIFLPIVLFGIFGNVLSIYILLKNRNIRTPSNLLIGNMAAADLFSLLIHPWVFLTYDLFQNYQVGYFGCKAEAAIECSIMIASVISVSAISYDRLTAIVLPRETRLTKNGAKIVMVVTWVVGFLVSTPLFIYRNYKERQWLNFLEKFCTENIVITNTYWYVIITVMVWLPLSIQLICYIAICVKLNKYEKKVLRKLDHHQVNYKKKAVYMMVSVIFAFMVCKMPFTALIIYRHGLLQTKYITANQISSSYHTFWFLSKLLMFVNSALNPLIYSVTNEKFRRGFKTTKMAKWLFPPERAKGVTKAKTTQKTADTTFFRNNLFFIFKRKHKPSLCLTNETIAVPISKIEIVNVTPKSVEDHPL